jgi:hypothetical protein
MPTPVTREQFVVTAHGVTHTPTGATFTPHPGSPNSGTFNQGQLGNVLKNGDDHRPQEVQRMMQRLWEEYVADNPYAFKELNAPIGERASATEPVKTYSRRFFAHRPKQE